MQRANRPASLFIAALLACIVAKKGNLMADPKPLPFKQLYLLGRSHASGAIPDESRQSLPVPVIYEQEVMVAFLFAPSVVRQNQPVDLFPPNYVAIMKLVQGKLVILKLIAPKDLGQSHPIDKPIGDFAMPAGMSIDEFTSLRDRLFELYDGLVPYFAAKVPARDPRVQASAGEFLKIFEQISEPPLKDYYQSLGKDFFGWLQTAGN